MKYIVNALEREEGLARRARESARNSRLGWLFDLEPRLRAHTAALTYADGFVEFKFSVDPPDWTLSTKTFQIMGHTNHNFLSCPVRKYEERTDQDEPAALVYSQNADGSIGVLLYPHKSTWKEVDENKCFIIGIYKNSNDLAGRVGHSIIKNHILLFMKLMRISRTLNAPCHASGKFLEKLERLNDKYSRMYSSKADHRRAKASAELALGAGLSAGLIASTLFPLLQTLGANSQKLVEQLKNDCENKNIDNSDGYQICLNHSNFHTEALQAQFLSPEVLAIFVCIVVAMVIGIMLRNLRIR